MAAARTSHTSGHFPKTMTIMTMVVGMTLLCVTDAYADDFSDVDQAKAKLPKSFYGNLFCQVLCQKPGGPLAQQCAQCLERKGDDAKRTVRGRRLDDFGLDDYLFMRLLGRNLEDTE